MTTTKIKTAFITGGASGIGLATAHLLLSKGYNVVIYSPDIPKTTEMKELNLNGRVLLAKGDVRKRNQVRKAMEAAEKKFGSLDILINNAGVAKREDFLRTTEKDWDFVIGVNVKGVFICMQEFIKLCETSNSCQGKTVINIASGAGIYGVDEIAVYSATKAAVINITQGLNEELKKLKMNFVTVCPGSTNTKMFKGLFPKEKPYHTPQQVADVIFKAIEKTITPDDRLIVDVFHHIK